MGEHRFALSCSTHLQDFTTHWLTELSSTRNLKRRPSSVFGNEPEIGSSQTEQVPHVIGQASDTPVSAQRFTVSLTPTHEQNLEIVVPA